MQLYDQGKQKMNGKINNNTNRDKEFDIVELHSSFCSIFVSPVRLRILWMLGNGEKNVGEMAEELHLSLPNLSQHLRLMRDLGAVRTKKSGRTVYYTNANLKFLKGLKFIREGLIEELKKRVSF
jgi:DNA-binding transcriptional ArsR family regulator